MIGKMFPEGAKRENIVKLYLARNSIEELNNIRSDIRSDLLFYDSLDDAIAEMPEEAPSDYGLLEVEVREAYILDLRSSTVVQLLKWVYDKYESEIQREFENSESSIDELVINKCISKGLSKTSAICRDIWDIKSASDMVHPYKGSKLFMGPHKVYNIVDKEGLLDIKVYNVIHNIPEDNSADVDKQRKLIVINPI